MNYRCQKILHQLLFCFDLPIFPDNFSVKSRCQNSKADKPFILTNFLKRKFLCFCFINVARIKVFISQNPQSTKDVFGIFKEELRGKVASESIRRTHKAVKAPKRPFSKVLPPRSSFHKSQQDYNQCKGSPGSALLSRPASYHEPLPRLSLVVSSKTSLLSKTFDFTE